MAVSEHSSRFIIIQNNGIETPLELREHRKVLTQIESTVINSARTHLNGQNFQEVSVSQMVPITGACENINTLFQITRKNGNHLYFAQTGQLALETALQDFGGVFTIMNSGRDELDEDDRHLREFRLKEVEFNCETVGMGRDNYNENVMFEALLDHIEGTTKAMIAGAIHNHGDKLQKVYGRDIDELQSAIDFSYLRISYEEAIRLLQNNGFPDIEWGVDLTADHEQKVLELKNSAHRKLFRDDVSPTDVPVFITHYPKDIKFFNMLVSKDDQEVVCSVDLILPLAGEAVGAAVREHDGDKLEQRLLNSRMFKQYQEQGGRLEDFRGYLDMIKSGAVLPHAGYGIGVERVMQYILGQGDIQICSSMRFLSHS